MKIAFFGHPHAGGTWSVFLELQAALSPQGIDLVWIGRGRDAFAALAASHGDASAPSGFAVGDEGHDDASEARSMLDAVAAVKADAVIVNVAADRVQMNVARYLPASVLRVMIVHNITIGTYAAASALRPHIHAAVGVSRRIRDDLTARYGFDPARTVVIPTALRIEPTPPRIPRAAGAPLRVISLGRIDEAAKGVLWLPGILARTPEVTLAVAGDGPELHHLWNACAPLGDRVRFLGAVDRSRVPALFAEHDAFLMPSRYEGQGLALLEAMAAGCVPVASRIRGVTDAAVQDGIDGLLFPVGDVAAAADALMRLRDAPETWAAMSKAAVRTVRERYAPETMADAYLRLFDGLRRAAPAVAPPLPLARWHFPAGLRDGWRTRVPVPIKNMLRTARERFA